MHFYRFILLNLYMLTLFSHGCTQIDFGNIFFKKPEISLPPSVESEILLPPIPEEEFDQDDISVPSKDNNAIRMGIIGAWKVSYRDVDCKLILTLTRFKKNFRGTARSCHGRLASLAAWNIIDEDSFELKNKSGQTIIVFYKTAEQSFEGSFQGESDKVIISR
ncbi:hypothetical protein BWK56_04765 [Candidatus Liberibacter asiaticus]|nr:AprI/Inh family metalloprotease inhibitor [Candidatus Liberibacter asiaticus]OMH86655.1 hypothetical protein BWK56_04765 [Candidatus Liberibacter asiaticus]